MNEVISRVPQNPVTIIRIFATRYGTTSITGNNTKVTQLQPNIQSKFLPLKSLIIGAMNWKFCNLPRNYQHLPVTTRYLGDLKGGIYE